MTQLSAKLVRGQPATGIPALSPKSEVPQSPDRAPGVASFAKRIFNSSSGISRATAAPGREPAEIVRKPSGFISRSPGSTEHSGKGILQRTRLLVSRTKRVLSRQSDPSNQVPPQAKPDEITQLSAKLLRDDPATGIPARSPQPEVPPEVEAPLSSPLRTGSSQSPGVSTVAGHTIARMGDLSPFITAPIRRAIEILRKPPVLLRRNSLGVALPR